MQPSNLADVATQLNSVSIHLVRAPVPRTRPWASRPDSSLRSPCWFSVGSGRSRTGRGRAGHESHDDSDRRRTRAGSAGGAASAPEGRSSDARTSDKKGPAGHGAWPSAPSRADHDAARTVVRRGTRRSWASGRGVGEGARDGEPPPPPPPPSPAERVSARLPPPPALGITDDEPVGARASSVGCRFLGANGEWRYRYAVRPGGRTALDRQTVSDFLLYERAHGRVATGPGSRASRRGIGGRRQPSGRVPAIS